MLFYSCRIPLQDGNHTVILSTAGENECEVPRALVQFLKYVKANLEESRQDFEDAYITKLQGTVEQIKKSREMEERHMIFEEMLRDEHMQGKTEGKTEYIIELLEELGEVSEVLKDKIMSEKNLERLSHLHKLAAKSSSIEEFLEKSNLNGHI